MYDIYTLLKDDTIESVSKKFGTTEEVLYQLNGFDLEIVPGMQIVVPKIRDEQFIYYTVKKGDNIYDIAKKYGVDYQLILSLNGLDKGDYIYPNQTLVIPRDDIFTYITKDGDSINRLVDEYRVDFEEFIHQNNHVFLKPEQIIFFKKKK